MATIIWCKPEVTQEQLINLGFLVEKGLTKTGQIIQKGEVYGNPTTLSIFLRDITDPTDRYPEIPQDIIDKVTMRDRIYSGFVSEGIYEHKTCTIKVEYQDTGNRPNQFICIAGDSIADVKEAHSMLRTGMLDPKQEWNGIRPHDKPKASSSEPSEEESETKSWIERFIDLWKSLFN